MRNLVYELSNGEIVKTQAEAKASGLPYKAIMQDVINNYDVNRLTETQARLRRSLAY